jgi:hypothetical protein
LEKEFATLKDMYEKQYGLVSELVAALGDIGKQRTYAEHPEDIRDDLDYEGGYDNCIALARVAIAHAKSAGYAS